MNSTTGNSLVQIGLQDAGTNGTLNVTGANTRLSLMGVESFLQLGRDSGASGTMNVSDGAKVFLNGDNSRVHIGREEGAVGSLQITGGSTVEVSGTLDSDVTVGGAFVTQTHNQEYAGTGLLNISGSNSRLTVGDSVVVGAPLSLSGISGSGVVRVADGGMLDANRLFVGAGGELNGDGTVNANVIGDGGMIAPGDSLPGILTINDDFTLNSGTLNLETKNGVSDQLAVSGSVMFGADAVINLLLDTLTSSTLDIDDYFALSKPIFDDDFLGSAISVITGDISQQGFTVDVFYGSKSVNVTAQVVPVPAAIPLFASALGLMGFMGWRRKNQVRIPGSCES